MTENEVKETKEWLQDFIRMFGCNFDDLETRSFNEIVVYLEELQQYRAIGTVEEFKALKEKVEPKKPLPKGTHKAIDNFYCPNCNHPLTNRHEQCELPYCDICGQKLDWQ